MLKKGTVVFLVLICIGFMAGCGGDKKAAEPAKAEFKSQLKLATMTPLSHTYNVGANKLAELPLLTKNAHLTCKNAANSFSNFLE